MPFIGLLAVVVCAAAPQARVASTGFRAIDVEPRKADFFASRFALELQGASGLAVVTPEEMASVLGLERQRALLGCDEASASCIAELAGGLGADVLISGTVARVGEAWALTVKVVDTRDAKVIAARTGQVDREGDVLAWLSETASQMGAALRARLGVTEAVAPTSSTSRGVPRRAALFPAIGAGVLALTGAALFIAAHGTVGAVSAGEPSIKGVGALDATLQSATGLQTAAVVTWGVAGAALLTASALWLFGRDDSSVTISLLATPTLGFFSLGGAL